MKQGRSEAQAQELSSSLSSGPDVSTQPLSLSADTNGKSIPCFPSGRPLKGKLFGDKWLLFISSIIGANGACAKGAIFPRQQKACM